MPRPLSFIHEEILRVAEDLSLDPRSTEFTRTLFLKHTEVSKRDLSEYGGFTKLKFNAAANAGLSPEKNAVASRGVELQNNYYRNAERIAASKTYYAEKVSAALSEVFRTHKLLPDLSVKKVSAKPPVGKGTKGATSPVIGKYKENIKVLTLLLSDLHFGTDVTKADVCANEYNWTVAARRMALLCERAAERSHCDQLRVVLNGDILQGVIHLDDRNIKLLTEQIWGATAILVRALDYLSKVWDPTKITVVCLPGNHDRTTYKNNTRELSQRWDSHAHSVFLATALAFRGTGMKFDIPTTGMALLDDLNGGYVLATHGDTEPDPQNVSKKIDTSMMTTKLLRIKESSGVNKNISVALFGHWHTPTVQLLPNGSTIIVNGCLIGVEPYGQHGVGVFSNEPAQVMFETSEGTPVSNIDIVRCKAADSLTRLDSVILPPSIFAGNQLVV